MAPNDGAAGPPSLMMRPSQTLPAALVAAIAATAALPVVASAQPARGAAGTGVPASMSLIREADLKRDLYTLAGPNLRGREAGTLDEMRASMWIADKLREIGVKPMGLDSSYFQWFNMRRTRVSQASTLLFLGKPMTLWKDMVPATNAQADVRGRTVWAGNGSDTTIDVRGRVVVAEMAPPTNPVRREGTNSYEYRYANAAIQGMTGRFRARGAAALILVADSISDIAFDGLGALRSRGTYDVDNAVPRAVAPPRANNAAPAPPANPNPQGQAGAPVFVVRRSMLASLRNGGDSAHLRVRTEVFETPSVNVVGVIRGTDPTLRNEYVLFSSHQDHDGVRYVIDGDSIWSGADDNGTVSVALLASARAFMKQPPRRSILFVYHGAEERGLLGSRYHARNPVVPLNSIVAVLNGDMIGRNHPDSATILGVQPPHRNSTELVAMALRANELTGKFKLDSIWDRPTHPEGWYFRSDHLPYARLNVPALMYSTNLHADYHTPRDKPERIDYAKLTKMTRWMFLTGWLVANTSKRPALDPGFQLER